MTDPAIEGMRLAVRDVIDRADQDVGIAMLSQDSLHWICPRCKSQTECKPDCTRYALLRALDCLSMRRDPFEVKLAAMQRVVEAAVAWASHEGNDYELELAVRAYKEASRG